MADPRLNSIHLDDRRRQEFRLAREALLASRGNMTLAGEAMDREQWGNASPHTLVQNLPQRVPSHLKCWLADKEFIYPLRTGLNTIGRAPENDVVIPDSFVSRRHCAILVHSSDSWELHDVASKNGTFLNGRKLSGPTPITPGDEIRMCDRHLVFMIQGADAAGLKAEHQPTQSH